MASSTDLVPTWPTAVDEAELRTQGLSEDEAAALQRQEAQRPESEYCPAGIPDIGDAAICPRRQRTAEAPALPMMSCAGVATPLLTGGWLAALVCLGVPLAAAAAAVGSCQLGDDAVQLETGKHTRCPGSRVRKP